MSDEKGFDLTAAMDRMPIPNHDQRTTDLPQQMFQKSNHMLTVQSLPRRLETQLELAPARRDTYCPDQVQALVVLDTGAQHRRLPAWRPGPFERRDQGKAAFIGEN